MAGVIHFLNANSGALNAVFSGVVALAAVVYALLTWRLVSETAKLRRAQTDAFVVVAAVPNQQAIGFLDLLVRNDGLGPAYEVKFSIEENTIPKQEGRMSISDVGFIKQGLPSLPARQEFRTFLTDTFAPEKLHAKVVIGVSYRTAAGQQKRHTYPLDCSLLENVMHLGTPFHQSVPKHLESIEKSLQRLIQIAENMSNSGAG